MRALILMILFCIVTRERTCRTPLVIASRAKCSVRPSPYQFYTYRSVLVIAMEHSDRSNLIADRSPHCVRDDNSLYARNDKK
ncbi:MAG: hypothetical protein J6A06_04335 [Fibrobacteraceae bacterium]|nr:hypothetical protein [Fibrobacteraceae bacterium]